MVRTVCLDEDKHSVTILRGLKQMKYEDDFCDFTIIVKGIEIPVHRNIIAVASPYFKAMLKHDTVESRERKVEMKDVDAECVKNCIDFMYSGKFDIPDGKIDKLLHVAIMMQLDNMKEAICKILDEELNAENFYQTRNVAEMYQLPTIFVKCETYYNDNFIEISAQPEFRNEPKTHLVSILESKKMKLSEDDKLSVSIRWVGDDPERKYPLLDLLKHIDLKKVTTSYLNHLLHNHLVISNDFRLYKLINEPLLGYFEKSEIPKKKNHNNELLVLFNEDADCLRSYDPKTYKVAKFHDEKFKHLTPFTALSMESYIYILCGDKSVHRLNFKDKNSKWERMEDMIAYHGSSPPSVAYSGSIFVIGCDNGDSTSDVEKFDIAAKEWFRLNDKPDAMSGHSVVTLDDSIYCIGGTDGFESLEAFCKFTPSASKWVDLEPMKKARHQCSAVAVEQKIFVMGGCCHSEDVSDVECYDVAIGQWTSLSSMIQPNSFIVAHHINGVIFSVPNGGVDKVEKYDISKDEWTNMDLNEDFAVYECVIVRKEVDE